MPERKTWEDVDVQGLLIPVNNPIPKFHPVQLSQPIVLTQVLQKAELKKKTNKQTKPFLALGQKHVQRHKREGKKSETRHDAMACSGLQH